jgi:hypothetical protein
LTSPQSGGQLADVVRILFLFDFLLIVKKWRAAKRIFCGYFTAPHRTNMVKSPMSATLFALK